MPVNFDQELKSLKIDRSQRESGPRPSRFATAWILVGIAVVAALVLWQGGRRIPRGIEVQTVRVTASTTASEPGVVLNATGYIVAHHKIELSSKVPGKVAWIGVEKGDRVRKGQVLVRLEDQEFRAQLAQASGNVANLEARLREFETGSRPEEIAAARANLAQAEADLE